ncbi:MAG: methyltransferase domain-containing protein [Deltaproteobacteria bacterium]|nr:methyltransferase domain-containing protein [Deltaproteobacteria bacterium]
MMGLPGDMTSDKSGAYRPEGIASKLLNLIHDAGAEMVLEVGCGTGHWLTILQDQTQVIGIDQSLGMLSKAVEQKGNFSLVQGNASLLPFQRKSFDMVYCVNALHHFKDPSGFITQAYELLKDYGVLALIGMNPHALQDRWFIYDYFPGTLEADLKRYPSPGTIADWMITAGFGEIRWQVAEHLLNDRHGDEVLSLTREFTSQLMLLSPEEFAKGKARLEADLRNAEKTGETIVFPVDISLSMVTGWVKGGPIQK